MAVRARRLRRSLTSAHIEIAAFGGAFLLMVFLKYFVDFEKDVHWIGFIEAPLTKVGRMKWSNWRWP